MSRFVLVVACVAVVLPMVLGFPWSNELSSAGPLCIARHGELREGSPEDYNGMELDESVDHVMQRREWCARWGDNCVPDAKVKFAKCCTGLRCDCGSPLLGAGKCQCKKESLFGR